MGTGTGGSFPLDAAIYMETSPRMNERVLMLMSIFWCFGRGTQPIFLMVVFASLAGYGFFSCSKEMCPRIKNMVRYHHVNLTNRDGNIFKLLLVE